MGLPLIDTVNLAQLVMGTTGSSLATMAQIDMSGYEGALAIGYTETTDAANQLIALVGSATDAMSELTGPDCGEASGKYKNLYLDVFRPPKRYLEFQMRASGTTGNIMLLAVRYGARALPTTQNTATWQGLSITRPVTGTATVSG